MLPTVPPTPTGCTDTVYTHTRPPDDVSGMRAMQTHVKMDVPETVQREHDTASQNMTSPGRRTPRDVAHVATTHRTRPPTSGTACRPPWTCSSTRARRPPFAHTEGSLPAQGANTGARAAGEKRAAQRRHHVRRRGTRAGWPAPHGEEGWLLPVPRTRVCACTPGGPAAGPGRARRRRKSLAAVAPGRAAAAASTAAVARQ